MPLADGGASRSERNHRFHAERHPAQTCDIAASPTCQQRLHHASPAGRYVRRSRKHRVPTTSSVRAMMLPMVTGGVVTSLRDFT